MWITYTLNDDSSNQYNVLDKISGSCGDIDVEIFSSLHFGKVALIDYKQELNGGFRKEIITQNFNFIESESIAMIPFCSIPYGDSTLRVLVCGTLNLEIARVLQKHGALVDVVLGDINTRSILEDFFSESVDIFTSNSVNIAGSFLDIKYRNYDIIIHLGYPSENEFEAMRKTCKQNFVMIFGSKNLLLESNVALQSFAIVNKFGGTFMPFSVSSVTQNFYVFLSNRYHSLADLQLQKSGMLEDMRFYDSNIHASVFGMPNIVNTHFRNYIKN